MRLLIIGNDSSAELNSAIDIAIKRKANVSLVYNVDEAVSYLRNFGADVVFIDIRYDISDFIKKVSRERININLVAYGLNPTAKDAVKAINSGAKEFLSLPPEKEMIAAIFSAIGNETRPQIFKSEAMNKIIQTVDKIVGSDAHVLITGRSGTGKEIMAHYIHNKSKRFKKSFVRVNCAAIPENLLESELFGHEKGAFTGALGRRIGKFEESTGGTLLLDEISEIDIKLQAKLLRAIQEHEIQRVGGNESIKLSLRIIATSNRNLPECVKLGTFREDLYFRLNVINIELPNLSERKEDIIPIAEFFIQKYCQNNDIPLKKLSKEAAKLMQDYLWPGNIRELENAIHRSVLLSTQDEIISSDLSISDACNNIQNELSEIEKKLIFNSLGDSNVVSSILGISIASLKKKLQEYQKKNQL